MPYEPYVTYEYYCDAYKGDLIPMDELDKALKQASRHVDSLTYNRIVDFEWENADEINTILQGYSINGVSAQFGSSWNVFTDKGVAMKRDVYALLSQTGLCCRLAR